MLSTQSPCYLELMSKIKSFRNPANIVIVGAEKRAALEKARHLTPEEAPVAAILRDTTVHWAES